MRNAIENVQKMHNQVTKIIRKMDSEEVINKLVRKVATLEYELKKYDEILTMAIKYQLDGEALAELLRTMKANINNANS